MEIKKVSIIGLGALGVLFGHHLATRMPEGDLQIIADRERISRYERDGVYCNGEKCFFRYVSPEEKHEADLLIFAVKFNDLKDAISAAKNQVGEKTIILSLLNGISSEGIIGAAYGAEKVLDCVAHGMDAVKVGNKLTYKNMGMISIGEDKSKTGAVARFFEKMSVPYLICQDMKKQMWGKFMLNVGVNQTVAVYETNYGGIQKEGEARNVMIAAMREVIALSQEEGVNLTEEDLKHWLNVLSPLNPEGKPSMRQDMEAKRFSEVEQFSGTVIALGKKYGIETPVNQMLYDKITAAEKAYSKC